MSKKNSSNIKPIIFQNKPIESEDKDLFDFIYQKQVLNEAIDSGSRIIGIVGNYGTGKSSITKLLEKDRKKKHDKIININLWGQFSTKPASIDNPNSDSLIKSFLYQLAFANKKRNAHFAKYINARFNKNNGKIGFAIATRKVFILLAFAALFIFSFFTLNAIDIKTFQISQIFSSLDKKLFAEGSFLHNLFLILFFSRYLILALGIALIVWAISITAPVFSSWKSEGKYSPDNSDIYEIYIRIVKKIKPFNKKHKCIIVIDDLDRSSDKLTVATFLKEIYKCIHLLPEEFQRQIVFIISLKAESLLNLRNNSKQITSPENPIPDVINNSDLDNLYSKIFDYTLNIKQIHNENYRDVVEQLLQQQKKNICKLTKKINKENQDKKAIMEKTLIDLRFIYDDEQLTIREIKDRLNETFLLYQTLLSRHYKNSSVELRKCAAVVFLKRKYEKEFNEILANEKKFAKLVVNCQKTSDKEVIKGKLIETGLFSAAITDEIIKIFSDKAIEDDFAMYLYSYPKNSYIKSTNEKYLYDALINDDVTFCEQENFQNCIDEVIDTKSGKVIYEAINKYLNDSIPEIIYRNEKLFSFVIDNFKVQRNTIRKIINNELTQLLSPTSYNPAKTLAMLTYDFNKKNKDELITFVNTVIIKILKQQIPVVDQYRNNLYLYFSTVICSLLPVFTTNELPLLVTDIYTSFPNDVKLNYLQSLSKERLQEFDDSIFSIDTNDIRDFLINKHLISSALIDCVENDSLESFNFAYEWICKELIRISGNLLEYSEDYFIKIRKAALFNLKVVTDDFYNLYYTDFPLITPEELIRIDINQFYFYINHFKITINNCQLLSDYCNTNKLQGENFYTFIYSLFMNEDKITDKNIIKDIFDNIDFNIINFSTLSEEQKTKIIDFLNPIYDLDDVDNSLDFIKQIRHLDEEIEIKFKDVIKESKELQKKYLNILNDIKQCSKNTLNILCNTIIDMPLVPEITDFLFRNKYYTNYIVGKTLYDKKLTYNPKIPLDKYYYVLNFSDECLPYFVDNKEIIDKFYDSKIYLEEELSPSKLVIYYKFRQPLDLIKTILSNLENEEDRKNYLHQITHINTEEDANNFITLITNNEFINLLKDESLFYYLWHRMWNKQQKQKFTSKVNKLLGTHYNSKDAGGENYE